jgi:hypothetical protein
MCGCAIQCIYISVVTLQTEYPYIQALSQDREQDVHPCAATYPIVPDPASQSRWAPELPRVQWLRIRLPDRKDPMRHVSCSPRSYLPTGRALVLSRVLHFSVGCGSQAQRKT